MIANLKHFWITVTLNNFFKPSKYIYNAYVLEVGRGWIESVTIKKMRVGSQEKHKGEITARSIHHTNTILKLILLYVTKEI